VRKIGEGGDMKRQYETSNLKEGRGNVGGRKSRSIKTKRLKKYIYICRKNKGIKTLIIFKR